MSFLSTLEWEAKYTADEAERDLGNGFVFHGCGWYIQENVGETLLIMPEDASMPWSQEREPRRVYLHFSENPASWFNVIISAPTRQDDRK